MNTVFIVTYFWNNTEDYDLYEDSHDILGVFNSYDSAYEAVQKIKAQHEDFCKVSLDVSKITGDEWYTTYRFEDYEEREDIAGTVSITWRTMSDDICCSGEHFFLIKEVELNSYSLEPFTLSD